MRNKIIVSLATLVLATLVGGYVYLSASCGRLLSLSEFGRFSATFARSFSHTGENGPSRTLKLLKAALSAAPSTGSEETKKQTITFPLPRYAVPQVQSAGEYSFVAFVTPREMDDYFRRELLSAGWTHVDQMGGAHILEGHNARMTVVQHFYLTSDISSFDVSIVEGP